MIYFIKANDRIKIGYATDPIKRLSSIQTSCPYKLEVILIIDGNYEKESEIHKEFVALRTSGEWFRYEDPLIKYIEKERINDRRYEFGFFGEDFLGNGQVLRYRKMHILSLRELGEKLSISAPSVKEIQDRERAGTVNINVLKKVAEALGYKFEYRFVSKVE